MHGINKNKSQAQRKLKVHSFLMPLVLLGSSCRLKCSAMKNNLKLEIEIQEKVVNYLVNVLPVDVAKGVCQLLMEASL